MSDTSASSSSDTSPVERFASLLLLLSLLAGCSSKSGRDGERSDASSGGASGASGNPGAGAGGDDPGLPPERLSEAGLYENLAESEALAAGVVEYRPRFELWADGAEKRRFLFIPPGARIDTSDMDYWVFPPGTRAFKEFSRDGVRVETRLLEKGPDGSWVMLAFAWNSEGTDALAVPRGSENAGGTEHDIPSSVMCRECHENMPDRLLGVGAVQLSHSLGGMTLDTLVTEGLVTDAPSAPIELPGNEVAQEALGYLHANCGVCHNRRSGEFPTVHLELHLEVGALVSVEETLTYQTTVGVPFEGVRPSPDIADVRIRAGDPEGSAMYQRMGSRESLVQMPPIATEIPDEAGLATLAQFISEL
jgi:hypothetical protein